VPNVKKPTIARKEKSGHGLQMGARHQDRQTDWLTDRPTVRRNLTSTWGQCAGICNWSWRLAVEQFQKI
jgi:hypothetical protein